MSAHGTAVAWAGGLCVGMALSANSPVVGGADVASDGPWLVALGTLVAVAAASTGVLEAFASDASGYRVGIVVATTVGAFVVVSPA
jgi:hypothetical protein